jgi:hypothetical protein
MRIYAVSRGHRGDLFVPHKQGMLARWPRSARQKRWPAAPSAPKITNYGCRTRRARIPLAALGVCHDRFSAHGGGTYRTRSSWVVSYSGGSSRGSASWPGPIGHGESERRLLKPNYDARRSARRPRRRARRRR